MSYWKITSKQGQVMGIYGGDEPVKALASMHRDAGVECDVEGGELVFDDPDQRQSAGTLADWIVEEARPEDLLEAAAHGRVDNIGGALREAREQLGLSRAELGRRFGFPVQSVERASGSTEYKCRSWADWERGRRTPGRDAIQQITAIAEAIRGARDDRGEVDCDHLRSTLAIRLNVDLPPETE